MKTLNESLIEEFDKIIEDLKMSKDEDLKKVNIEKLRRIYKELLNHKNDSENFESAARTVLNTVISKEFKN